MDHIDISPYDSDKANTSRADAGPLKEEVITIKGPTDLDSLYYDMSKKKYLHIFNHFKFRHALEFGDSKPTDRVGTHFDVKILYDTFTSLGFDVTPHQDYTYAKIKRVVEKLCQQDHKDTSCVALAILTHGSNDGYLFAEDKPYKLNQITTLLETQSLVMIPKLLFLQISLVADSLPQQPLPLGPMNIWRSTFSWFHRFIVKTISIVMDSMPVQPWVFRRMSRWQSSITRYKGLINSRIVKFYASIRSPALRTSCDTCEAAVINNGSCSNRACRGHALDEGHQVVVDGLPRNLIHVPSHIDFLILHSAADGHVSFRCDEEGSWMIQSLCKIIKEYHTQLDLLQMITLVNKRVSLQTAFNKKIIELNFKKQSIEARFTLTKFLKL